MLSQIRTILSVIIIMALLLSSALLLGKQPTAAADGEELDLPPIELPEKGLPWPITGKLTAMIKRSAKFYA